MTGPVLAGILLFAGCSPKARYSSPTHVDPVQGNCDRSRIVEVGAVLDLSGPDRAVAQAFLTGLRAAAESANRNKGVLKDHRCVELLYKDDRGDAHVGDKAVSSLVNDEGVAFLVAPSLAPIVDFAKTDIGLSGVPTVSLSPLTMTSDPHRFRNTFPVVTADQVEAAVLAQAAVARGWRKVAVAAGDDLVGREEAGLIAGALGSSGRLAGQPETVTPAGAVAGLRRLQSLGADGLIAVGSDQVLSGIVQARSSMGWEVPALAPPALGDPGVADAAPAAALAGFSLVAPKAAVLAATESPAAAAVVAFRDSLVARLGRPMTSSIVPYAAAYDGLTMLVSVANSVHSIRPADIRVFLENANYQGLLAAYSYTSSHHGGIAADDLTTVAASSLQNGLYAGS